MNKRDYIILGLIGIYIILLPLAPSSNFEWALCGLLALVGLVYLYELIKFKTVRDSFKENFKVIMLDRFSMLFIALILIMTFTATYSNNKIASIKEASRFAFYGYTYFLIRFRFKNEQIYSLIVKIYMLSLLIVNIIGLYDFYKHYNPGYSLMEILNTSRVKSTLGHPNAYGAYLILAIFPTIMIALKSKKKERLVYGVLAILLCANLALTFSRNAWLALAIGILLLTIIYSWRFIFLCVIPIIFVLFSPNILMRVRQLTESGLNVGRLRLWKVAERIIGERLFTGVGSGNFVYAYKDYVKKYPELQILEASALPPHNTYIKAFAELGIFGAMVFLLLCVEIVRKVFVIRDLCDGVVKKFYYGYLISVVCFFIMNCFDDLFFAPKVTMNFILFISIAFTIGHGETAKSHAVINT